MRGVLLLTPGAVQLSQLPPPSFHFPSTPICLLCALDLRPIQVHVCGSGPSHATLNPCKATGATLELTFQLRHCRQQQHQTINECFHSPSLIRAWAVDSEVRIRASGGSYLLISSGRWLLVGTTWMSLNIHVGDSHVASLHASSFFWSDSFHMLDGQIVPKEHLLTVQKHSQIMNANAIKRLCNATSLELQTPKRRKKRTECGWVHSYVWTAPMSCEEIPTDSLPSSGWSLRYGKNARTHE